MNRFSLDVQFHHVECDTHKKERNNTEDCIKHDVLWINCVCIGVFFYGISIAEEILLNYLLLMHFLFLWRVHPFIQLKCTSGQNMSYIEKHLKCSVWEVFHSSLVSIGLFFINAFKWFRSSGESIQCKAFCRNLQPKWTWQTVIKKII